MNGFVLQQPWALAGLLLVPVLALLFRRARRKRDALLQAYGGARKLDLLARRRERRHGEWCALAGLTLLIAALARPGANPRPQSNPEGGRDVVFVLDVSRSMLADDVRPSRLARAKEDIARCLAAMPNNRAGLVLFAGDASIRCPLTTDYDFLRAMLKDVGPDSVALGSTYLQSALEKTTDQMLNPERKGFEDVIFLTDGGDQGSHPEATLAVLNATGARLLVVGYGDPKIGARIPEGDEPADSFVIFEGREIWSRMEEGVLRSLAGAATHGEFVRGGTPGFDLGRVYQRWSEKAPRQYLHGQGAMEYDEYFAWLLVPALALLLWPFSGLFRRISPSLLAGLMVIQLHAADAPSALDRLRELASAETNVVRRGELSFQLGVALMKNSAFEDAARLFRSAANSAPRLAGAAICRYNEALAEAGLAGETPDPGAQLSALDAAIGAMRSALLLRADWPVAARGLEVLYARRAVAVESLKLQQQQQDELNQQAEAMQKELARLLEAQRKLLAAGRQIQRDRTTPDAERLDSLKTLRASQSELGPQTEAVRTEMAALRERIARAISSMNAMDESTPADPPVQTGLEEPLQHLAKARAAQDAAVKSLGPLDQLPGAVQAKQQAVSELEAALQSFAAGQSSDSGESDESDEDMDMTDTESDNDASQTMPMKGDFLSDPVNRELPKPNFSPEEIMQEEQANAETRTKNKAARVGKGEKDW